MGRANPKHNSKKKKKTSGAKHAAKRAEENRRIRERKRKAKKSSRNTSPGEALSSVSRGVNALINDAFGMIGEMKKKKRKYDEN